jgi:hypothetical protein
MASAAGATNSDYPYPPRYWWLKRIVIASLLMIVALAVWRIVLGRIAGARLDAAVNQIAVRGERIAIADFTVAAIDDDQNVVTFLRRAGEAMSQTDYPPRATNMDYFSYLPLPDEWYVVARKAMAANQPSLAMARAARQRTKVDWQLQLQSPAVRTMLPMLNEHRALASLLADAAFYQHLQGNDDEALDHLLDLFHAADAIDVHSFLISRLVAIGMSSMGMTQTQVMAPGLKLDSESQRQKVRQLIAVMLDRTDGRRVAAALAGERAFMLDMSQWMTRGSHLLRPTYQVEISRLLRFHSEWIAAATQPTLSDAGARSLAAKRAAQAGNVGLLHELWRVSFVSYDRLLQTDFQLRTEAALTAVCLAARLYQVDHDGRWPAKLEELVPGYLPQVPADPMASDAQPLRIAVFDNGSRPVVYSIGADGHDDTADGSAPPARPQYGMDGRTADQWRDLSRVLGAQPATQPQDE